MAPLIFFFSQRATKARRVSAHALHAVWHTPGTSVKLLQALGACRGQKSRRISSKFSRFSPKIASFCRRLSRKKQGRSQEKLRVLRSVQQTIVHIILMQRACVGGRNRADFQIFLTQNRANFNRKTAREDAISSMMCACYGVGSTSVERKYARAYERVELCVR